MRKQIVPAAAAGFTPQKGELDVAAIAVIRVTSESAHHPVENAFDGQRGPGSSRWVAATDGEQTLVLVFDAPTTIHGVVLEIEETDVSRTQQIQLAISSDGGQTFHELRRQEYCFSPPGTTYEREEWIIQANEVTHLQLWIKPDKADPTRRASVTALTLH